MCGAFFCSSPCTYLQNVVIILDMIFDFDESRNCYDKDIFG